MIPIMKNLTGLLCILLCVTCARNPEDQVEEMDRTEEEIYFEDYVSDEKKWGYMNLRGIEVINPKFDAVRDFRGRLAPVNFEGKWGMIDTSGSWIIAPEYQGIWPFQNGLARVKVFEKGYGFVNKSNEMIIPPNFENVYDFQDGLAKAEQNGYYGFIDTLGNWQLEPQYQSVENFIDGFAIIKNNDGYGLIDQDGGKVLDSEHDRISMKSGSRQVLVKDEYGYRYFDLISKSFSQPYNQATLFSDERAWVRKDGKWDMIDADFNMITTKNLKSVIYAGESIWILRIDGGFTLMDQHGIELTSEVYMQINKFFNNRAVFLKGDRWGFLDTRAQEIIPPTYLLAWDFRNGFARVADEYGMYIIDTNGEKIMDVMHPEIRDFHNNRARFQEL